VNCETSNYGYIEGSSHQDETSNPKSLQQPICNDPYPLQYPVTDSILTSSSLLSESWYQKQTSTHDNHNGRDPLLVEGFEPEDMAVSAGGKQVLAIPLHIRSSLNPDTRNDDGKSWEELG